MAVIPSLLKEEVNYLEYWNIGVLEYWSIELMNG
jgi:hypothetical protein